MDELLLRVGKQELFPVPECPLLAVSQTAGAWAQLGQEEQGPKAGDAGLSSFALPAVLRGH